VNNTTLKILTIIQARTSSSRLPGKILLSAVGKPLLLHMFERVSKAKYSGKVVIATTTSPEDDIIEDICRLQGISVYRGHPTDLLDRHYKAALKYEADVVLKIPSDCPLIDPDIIDEVIDYYLKNIDSLDFASNLRPPTFPDGNDVEIFSFETLEQAWKKADQEYEREHTTPYIWNNPSEFRIGNVFWKTGLDYSNTHRWTLDYEEDYTFIRQIFEELYKDKPNFGMYDILNLLNQKPYLRNINKHHAGKFWYNNHNFDLSKDYGI
jgi:spore coat polysaccharide biosynthesis protein SpsF